MAIVSQLGSLPVVGGDVSCTNYGVTDIAAGIVVVSDTTANHFMGIAAPATSAVAVQTVGITVEKIAAGKTGRVRILGGAVATANATIAIGDPVMIDTTSGHEGQVAAFVTAKTQLGRALSAAQAGDPIIVWVNVVTNTSGA